MDRFAIRYLGKIDGVVTPSVLLKPYSLKLLYLKLKEWEQILLRIYYIINNLQSSIGYRWEQGS